MDLPLYGRVLWRFRLLVAMGVLLAIVLALLAVAKVNVTGSPALEYRQSELWVSRATILITEPKFPEGRSVFQQTIPPASDEKTQEYAPAFADPQRFINLANLYAQLATSDQVRQILLKDGPLRGTIESAPVSTVNGSASLPLLSIGGIAQSPAQARALAQRAVNGFLRYLEVEQARSDIPAQQRVVLQVVKQPNKVELLKGRPVTLPIVIFLAVLLGVFGIVFMLENLRPRLQEVPPKKSG